MAKLFTAPILAAEVARLKANPPHALLLHGEPGVGLATLAGEITHHSAYVLQPLNTNDEYDPKRGTISVHSIRELYQHTRGQGDTQFVVIDDAERMTTAAQNALLKLLEEPPAHVRFVLTSHTIEGLLPTIRSRVQLIHVPRISAEASKKILQAYKLSASETAQLLFIAAGRPALLTRLATNLPEREQAASSMKDARAFLSARTPYERAVVAAKYSSSGQAALTLIDSALSITDFTMKNTPSAAIAEKAALLLETRTRIVANASPRLQLMRIVVK